MGAAWLLMQVVVRGPLVELPLVVGVGAPAALYLHQLSTLVLACTPNLPVPVLAAYTPWVVWMAALGLLRWRSWTHPDDRANDGCPEPAP